MLEFYSHVMFRILLWEVLLTPVFLFIILMIIRRSKQANKKGQRQLSFFICLCSKHTSITSTL